MTVHKMDSKTVAKDGSNSLHIAAATGQLGLVKYFTRDCQMDPQTVNEVRCVNPLVRVTDVVCMI